jgi:hypothetical protein
MDVLHKVAPLVRIRLVAAGETFYRFRIPLSSLLVQSVFVRRGIRHLLKVVAQVAKSLHEEPRKSHGRR